MTTTHNGGSALTANAETAITPRADRQRGIAALTTTGGWTPEQVSLIRNTIAKGATDDELRLFIAVAGRTGLDPFTRQIHCVKRWDSNAGREVMAIQTGIDGYRLIAARTGEYAGQDPPQWCGPDGVWVDVWLSDSPPAAARVAVYRKDRERPTVGVARWRAYCQTKKGGEPNSMWQRFSAEMLAKCAEALALRKEFPQDLADLYTDAEVSDELPRDTRGHYGVKNAAERSTADVLDRAMDEPETPEQETGDDDAGEDDAPVGSSALTLTEFFAVCKKAKSVTRGRTFVKEAPTASGQWYFIDQGILTSTLLADEQPGSVLLQKDGEQVVDQGRLERLHAGARAVLDDAASRAA